MTFCCVLVVNNSSSFNHSLYHCYWHFALTVLSFTIGVSLFLARSLLTYYPTFLMQTFIADYFFRTNIAEDFSYADIEVITKREWLS